MGDELVAVQGFYFSVTVLLGFVMGILFDFYRTCRYFWKPSRCAAFFFDLVFSLLVTVMVFLVLLAVNWGEIRLFVFIGISAGIILYYLCFSAYVLRIFQWFLKSFLFVVEKAAIFFGKGFAFFASFMNVVLYPFFFLRRLGKGWTASGKEKGKIIGRRGKELIKKWKSNFLDRSK
ncbi:MAG TPA: hypothetical protein GX697_07065 [Firmicutes bacterium]|nr:hypothetical protein [Bacillota bacterium]